MSSQIATLSSCLELLKPQFKPSRVNKLHSCEISITSSWFFESFRLSSREVLSRPLSES